MTYFVPNSTFGRHALRTALESRGSYITIQLLNVPAATPGDRSTWTWANNWRQYAIAGAYSSGSDALDLLSVGSGSGVITLWEVATSPDPGAYYDDGVYGSPQAGYTNTSLTDLEFTHIAVFTMQTNVPVTTPATALSDDYLAFVFPYDSSGEDPVLLPAGQRFYDFIGEGNLNCSSYPEFSDWVAADEAITIDSITSGGLYTYPYVNSSIIFNIVDDSNVDYGYYNNTQQKAYFRTLRDYLLELNSTRTHATFLAELLDVTGTEPDFETGWSGWSSYRINHYAFATTENSYKYEEKQGSWLLDLGLVDPAYSGDYVEITWTGEYTSFKNPCEFVISAPTSGSFTFTHIAVFINEGAAAPQQGTSYTYSDTDRFVGVIKLPTGVTMTTSSTARAYPFNFGLMFQPQATYVEL